ncbi:MAG: hypothetical protein IJ512_08995 [Ruminococcus sp.]|nr:hypothetical protein [Ruminococcus sp.]
MLKAILQEMKARLQAECPFEVRYAHSRAPVPAGDRPFLLLDVKSIAADTPSAEGAGRMRYPVTAVVTVTAAAPLRQDVREMQRILAAYVLPVMIHSGCSICGFGSGEMTDSRLLNMHTAEVQFRLRGVYTVVWEEDADV